MVDLSSYLIETIEGSNKSPVAPSNNDGGNISYRDEKFNQFVAAIQTTISDLEQQIADLQNNNNGNNNNDNNYTFTANVPDEELDPFLNFTEDGTIAKIIVENATDIYSIFYSLSGDILSAGVPVEVDGKWEVTFDPLPEFYSDDDFTVFSSSGQQDNVTFTIITS